MSQTIQVSIDIDFFTQEQINSIPSAIESLLSEATTTRYQFKWDGAGTLYIVDVADDDKTDFKTILSQANVEAKMAAQDIERKIPRAEDSGPGNVEVGSILLSPTSSKIGCLRCNGAAVSRQFYVNLFAVIETSFGSGDGSTTFNVPNLPNLLSGIIPIYYLIKY